MGAKARWEQEMRNGGSGACGGCDAVVEGVESWGGGAISVGEIEILCDLVRELIRQGKFRS